MLLLLSHKRVNTLTAAAGTDKGRMRSWHMAGAFTYRNGPVELGTFFTMLVQPNTHFPFTVPAGPALRDDATKGLLAATS